MSIFRRLVVADSKRAFGLAAASWRSRFALPVIAVAGSNGKTTVKQMIAAILAAAYGDKSRLATRGNLNNDIGVPLMLWQLSKQHRAAVFELGMNHPGEIAYLAELVQPTVALVNNAQREHQEFMQSVEATAYENGEAIAGIVRRRRCGVPGRRCMCADLAAAGRYAARDRLRAGGLGRCARRPFITQADGVHDFDGDAHGIDRCATGCRRRAQRAQRTGCCGCCVAAASALTRSAAGLNAWRPVAGRGVRLRIADCDADRRHLQRQSRLGAGRDRCAGTQRRGRACWCWATWAKSATRGRSFIARSAPMRTSAASMRCLRSGR